MTSTAYLVINRRGISRMTKSPPSLRTGEVCVRLAMEINPRFLAQFMPTVNVNLQSVLIEPPSLTIDQLGETENEQETNG